jgi:hypothetical protein
MKNTMFSLTTIMISVLFGSMTSCEKTKESTPPGDPVPIELSLKQKEVVGSANKFAFELLRKREQRT